MAIGGALLLHNKSEGKTDETRLLFGCYLSELAPPILIDDRGLSVLGGPRAASPISARIVTTKNGERQIEIGERLIGQPATAGYILDRDDSHGQFISLSNGLGPQYALTDMVNFTGFVIPTDDGDDLFYAPASLDECRAN